MKVILQAPILSVLFLLLGTSMVHGQTNAWINEIHYDNTGTDVNETIEIVVENSGTLSDYTVYTYNGNGGDILEQETLNNLTVGATMGNFTIYTWTPSPIQNGHDGIAIAYQGTLIAGQFLSYEGTLTASEGPANGQTSTDIGVAEDGTTLSTESLQLTGSGGLYSDFTWQTPTTSTFGAVNTGQTLTGGGNPSPFITNIVQTPAANNVTPADAVSVSAEVTDGDGVASVTLNWGTASGNLFNAVSMNLVSGDIYTTTTNIPAQTDGTTIYYEIVAVDTNTNSAIATSTEQNYTSQIPVAAPALIISEVADPGDNVDARFVEIYNNGSSFIDFSVTTIFLARYANANTNAQSVQLTGGLAPGDFYVIADNMTNFNVAYGFDADMDSGIISGNGNDTYTLYIEGDWDGGGTLFDIYGEIGTDGTGEAWEYLDARAVRNNLSTAPNSIWTASEWTITFADVADMTPGQAEASTNYTYNGTSWSPSNPNGNANLSDNITVQSGTASFLQDIVLNNLSINTGAILNIEQVLKVSGDIVNNGNLIFISDGNKLGQLAEMSATSTITGSGTITVQRYVPARRAFRLISPSVTTTTNIHTNWQEGATSSTDNPNPGFGTHITGSTTDQQNGFDGTTTGNPSLFLFDNTAQAWGAVPNTDMEVLHAGKAYRLFVRGDRTTDLGNNADPATNTILNTTGTLVVGNHTVSNLSAVAGDFNFIGNPYRSIVNMNDVFGNSTNLNANHYYVWDPNINARGAYVTVSLPAGTNILGSAANQYLQPGQAVFINTATSSPASLLFEESDKAPYKIPTAVFRGVQNNPTASILLQLYERQAFINRGSVADGLMLKFDANESNAVLLNDAAKLGNIDENVAVVNGSDYLSIENRALPVDGEILPLFNNQYRHYEYTYKVKLGVFSDTVKVYLKDAYLHNQTPLTKDGITTIDFSVDETIPASIASDRFSFVFTVNNFSVEKNSINGFKVYPNPARDGNFTIAMTGMTGEIVQISLYNLLGQKIVRANRRVDANNRVPIKTLNLEAGIYLMKLTHRGKTSTEKVIIQ